MLLLDEPFGALDAKVRKELRASLRHLHEQIDVTTIFVTHDQEEAMELADEIVVVNKGRIEQVGPPAEIYDNPATPFVMSFVGPVNVLSSSVGIFRSSFESPSSQVFLRPHDILIYTQPDLTSAPAKINRIVHLGWEIEVECLLLVNLYLIQLRWQLTHQEKLKGQQQDWLVPIWSAICGSTAGVLTGLFSVGGGILLVPLQILLLGETVDITICTSLGVVLLTSLSACTSHLLGGSILFTEGLILGITGSFGAQIGTRLLPKLPGMMVVLSAQVILVVLGIRILWLIWTRSPTRVLQSHYT